jgi:hypothetical protein
MNRKTFLELTDGIIDESNPNPDNPTLAGYLDDDQFVGWTFPTCNQPSPPFPPSVCNASHPLTGYSAEPGSDTDMNPFDDLNQFFNLSNFHPSRVAGPTADNVSNCGTVSAVSLPDSDIPFEELDVPYSLTITWSSPQKRLGGGSHALSTQTVHSPSPGGMNPPSDGGFETITARNYPTLNGSPPVTTFDNFTQPGTGHAVHPQLREWSPAERVPQSHSTSEHNWPTATGVNKTTRAHVIRKNLRNISRVLDLFSKILSNNLVLNKDWCASRHLEGQKMPSTIPRVEQPQAHTNLARRSRRQRTKARRPSPDLAWIKNIPLSVDGTERQITEYCDYQMNEVRSRVTAIETLIGGTIITLTLAA